MTLQTTGAGRSTTAAKLLAYVRGGGICVDAPMIELSDCVIGDLLCIGNADGLEAQQYQWVACIVHI